MYITLVVHHFSNSKSIVIILDIMVFLVFTIDHLLAATTRVLNTFLPVLLIQINMF